MAREIKLSDRISKKELMETLGVRFDFCYRVFPEGESSPEDYDKRVLRSQGFLDAMQIVNTYNEG